MTLRGEKIIRSNGRSPVVPLALLCLTLHAFFVSITHHHSGKSVAAPAVFALESGEGRDSDGAPSSVGHANCLSCRLQRTFAADLPSPSVTIDLPQAIACGQELAPDKRLRGPFLVLSDRAPPLA